MTQDGTNKTVVITGAASGIGAGTARWLVDRGWQVIGLDRSFEPGLAKVASTVFQIQCDVASVASVDAAFATIGECFGRIDALVVAAGVLRVGALDQVSVEDFDILYQVNTRGAWACAKAATPLLTGGGENTPRIVFIGSIGGLRPKIGNGAYSAQKAALHVMCGVMAAELGPRGIRVNTIAPGTVDTPMIRTMSDESRTGKFRPSGTGPLGRVATPEDIAGAVEFLLGPLSDFITGTVIPVDGGTRAAFVPSTVKLD